MAVFLAPIINNQIESDSGAPLSGGTIETYLAGTSTPATTWTSNTGLTAHANPIVLNTLGLPNTAGSAVWLTSGIAYKFIIKDSLGVLQRTIDNITGIGDVSTSSDLWVVYSAPAVFINATSFSVVGDQRGTFPINIRVRTVNSGGTIYSRVTNSVFAAGITTVTVVNSSGVLDSGLSQVSYSAISPINTPLPSALLRVTRITVTGPYTPGPGTNSVIVELVGGGGGGGATALTPAANTAVGSSGGAGGYAKSYLTSGFTGVTATIGAAGTAGLGAGGNGGTTSFGALLQATGGLGGTLGTASPDYRPNNPTAGGLGTGGNILNAPGGAAAYGFYAPSPSVPVSGAGGASFFGPGGQAQVATSLAGIAGVSPGSGGSGAIAQALFGAGLAGGAGAPGLIIVYEYL